MTVEHSVIPLYNEKYNMYPVMHIISFLTPSHAILYNTFANYKHWIDCKDDKAQLAIMQTATPKMKFNRNKIWNCFVKKPKQDKTKTYEKEENYLMYLYEISRKTAKLYLEIDGVLDEVKDKIKNY